MRKIKNTEIAQKVLDALQADKDHQYEEVTFEQILDQIDRGRNLRNERTPENEDIFERYIDGFKQQYEILD